MDRLKKIYEALGVSPDYDGAHAAEFHRLVHAKYDRGMIRGHTSIVRGATAEQIVREQLAIEWEIAHGFAVPVRRFLPDYPWWSLAALPDRLRTSFAAIKGRIYKTFWPNPYRAAAPPHIRRSASESARPHQRELGRAGLRCRLSG